ncbi:hypothetical protein [Enterovibrio paralichthyis]|uniref:hypothetical protein n=1 Tax=Enterovibrio paralichthyis TaxID=2853805 RepID=UPI001C43B3AB|nr:hypothetical protein [Enterovibrio paralichthyis]MBV7296721.1 hypothetical protein [Enterovibrio paralichthyis]
MSQPNTHKGISAIHPTCTDVSNRQSLVGSICLSIVLMALSFVFLSYDVFFDAIEIETLVGQSLSHASDFLFASQALTQSELPLVLVLSFCALLLHFFLFRLARVTQNKTPIKYPALSLDQPIQSAHGCRAPPLFIC